MTGNRHCWRTRVVARTPVALLEAPFEVFMAALGLIAGPIQLFGLGLTQANVLTMLLPDLFETAWAISLICAAISLIVGLRKGGTNPPTAAGLRLMGWALMIYALAALGVAGSRATITVLMFLLMAMLCGLRSFTITTGRQLRAEVRLHSEADQ